MVFMAEFDALTQDPADLLPETFSIHHLVWLHRHSFLHDAPYELGPFPATLDFAGTGKFDIKIKEHLTKWGILTDDGLHPEARWLFETLLGKYEWAVWGTVVLHNMKTNARQTFDPKGADDWGLKYAVRDEPRVPLMIAVTDREIVTAVNAGFEGLVLNRIARIGNPHKQVGTLLKGILDPPGNWEPWSGPRVSLPHRAARQIAENPETGKITDDDDLRTEQVTAIKKTLRQMELSPATVDRLTDLAGFPHAATLNLNINYPASSGVVSPSVAMGVVFLDGAGIVVSYPVGRSEETRTLYYVPGDEAGFTAGIEAMVQAAEYAAEDKS